MKILLGSFSVASFPRMNSTAMTVTISEWCMSCRATSSFDANALFFLQKQFLKGRRRCSCESDDPEDDDDDGKRT